MADGRSQFFARVASVGEDRDKGWINVACIFDERRRAVAILNIGCMDVSIKDIAERVGSTRSVR